MESSNGSLISLNIDKPILPVVPEAGASALLEVTDDDSYAFGVTLAQDVKTAWNRADQERQKLKAPALESCRLVDDFFRPYLTFCNTEEAAIKAKLRAYLNDKEQTAFAAQAEANRVAEAERAALNKQADKAEKKGNGEKAEALREQAAITSAAHVDTEAPKVAGSSTRSKWMVTVTDKEAFLQEVAKNPSLLLSSVDINIGALVRLASALGHKLSFSGISCERDKSIAIGRSRIA